MNPDLYAAWYTAGTNLQTVGDWAGAHWIWLTIAASATSTAWAAGKHIHRRRHIRHGIRRLNQYACHAPSRPVLDDFHQPRKEKPQP